MKIAELQMHNDNFDVKCYLIPAAVWNLSNGITRAWSSSAPFCRDIPDIILQIDVFDKKSMLSLVTVITESMVDLPTQRNTHL